MRRCGWTGEIGRLYGSFDPHDAVPLDQARFAAVKRLAALAAREQVDAVAVAGPMPGGGGAALG